MGLLMILFPDMNFAYSDGTNETHTVVGKLSPSKVDHFFSSTSMIMQLKNVRC